MNTLKVFRYDSLYKTVEAAEVYAHTPLDSWIPAMIGDGMIIYSNTELKCLQYKADDIKDEIEVLQKELIETEYKIKESV